MLYNELINQYSLDENKLLKYGFTKKEHYYEYKTRILDEDLYAIFEVSLDKFEVNVIDGEGEIYLPFNVIESEKEGYSLIINNAVNDIIYNILGAAFCKTNNREILMQFLVDKFETKYEFPWEDSPSFATFKTELNKKWYALFMTISYKCLKIDSQEKVDVFNCKVDPLDVEKLVDNKVIFNAYHMNKKHWITAIIDKNSDIEFLKSLLVKSYFIVEK